MTAVVYWIFDKNCISIEKNGYVGVTTSFKRRKTQHQRGRFCGDYSFKILFEGSVEECLEIEHDLRPRWNMGWNEAPGGPYSYSFHSEEARRRVGDLIRGRPRTKEDRAKISTTMKGRILSSAHKQNLSKPCSNEKKKKISCTLTGQLGRPHSEQSKLLISQKMRTYWEQKKCNV